MEFKQYQHIERLGTDEVDGLTLGACMVFPKIDGTNASIWLKDDGSIGFGSRKRELSLDNDNAGFMAAMLEDESIRKFFDRRPGHRLYGEWLVPHSLKTYEDGAWRKFYVFDIRDENEAYVPYDEYKLILDGIGMEYIPPIYSTTDPTDEQLYGMLEHNTFLVQDGLGKGEGIVIKNYDFVNRFGHTVWAKIVSAEFKAKHVKEMGPPEMKGALTVERDIVDKYVTKPLAEKVFAKIKAGDGWSSRMIPRLLQTVFYDLVREDCWNFVKAHKNPTIDFRKLQALTYAKVKTYLPEVF